MSEWIYPTQEDIGFPVVDILTGRGFITGKSGSGKSNTAGIILEELLESNYPFLIVDTEGEYYGLKEDYEILHVGADESCDVMIGAEHADRIAKLALEDNVPIVLDVSGYLDEEESKKLVKSVLRKLFVKEKKLKKPFLTVIEECHEYIPEKVQLDECGQMVIRIAKRGRKRGLGIIGISQRPANVKKDFITQANYKIWHLLDWDNDLDVVRRVLDKDAVNKVKELEVGEALIDADFIDERAAAKFKERQTFHAGQTPTLSDFETPELRSVSEELIEDLEEISEQQKREKEEKKQLQEVLEQKEEKIETLQERVNDLKDHSSFAERFIDAIETTVNGEGDDEERNTSIQIPGTSTHEDVLEKLDAIEALLRDNGNRTAGSDSDKDSSGARDLLASEAVLDELRNLADSTRASKKALLSTVSYLENNEGTVKEITTFAGYSDTSSVSRAVRALRDAGIVHKSDVKDGRNVYSLSEEGTRELISRTSGRARLEELEERV